MAGLNADTSGTILVVLGILALLVWVPKASWDFYHRTPNTLNSLNKWLQDQLNNLPLLHRTEKDLLKMERSLETRERSLMERDRLLSLQEDVLRHEERVVGEQWSSAGLGHTSRTSSPAPHAQVIGLVGGRATEELPKLHFAIRS